MSSFLLFFFAKNTRKRFWLKNQLFYLYLHKFFRMKTPISITGMGSISALGSSSEEIWNAYLSTEKHFFSSLLFEKNEFFSIGKISQENYTIIENLKNENAKYKSLDKSVLYAIYAARNAVLQAQWQPNESFGINIGSSRGATELFEKFHSEFLQNKQCSPLTSPTTTLGNIASWVGQDVQNKGITISHSITCSTALHALINGIAWLTAQMSDKFLIGGSEAPLTPFTLSQMKALKIYANANENYPCQPLQMQKTKNTMVLGEGACVFCLEKGISEKSLAVIKGIGYASEPLTHNISISENADCFQQTMAMALQTISAEEIDVIIPHATGTIKGDQAELNAIKLLFKNCPSLTSNKWKIGHTFGASGAFSLEMAILMLQHQQFIGIPYLENRPPKRLKNILINAVGFGGNAVSVVIGLP